MSKINDCGLDEGNEEKLSLEKEFEKTAEAINAKVKEATEALKEANRLASEAGLPALIYTQWTREDDDYEYSEEELEELESDEDWDGEATPLERKINMLDVSELEGQLEQAGWSTSSSYC
jgi:hypothetical protein